MNRSLRKAMTRQYLPTAGLAGVILLGTAGVAGAQSARDYINVVGSSTVYPFATVVAERFGKTTDFKTPKIESTGSGGGSEAVLCRRRRTASGHHQRFAPNQGFRGRKVRLERRRRDPRSQDWIRRHRPGEFQEGTQLDLSLKDLFLALAKSVPDPAGGEKLVPNPYKTWKEVNANLPDRAIEVLGPPPTSGTRDAFAELALEGGCKAFDWIKAMNKADKNQYKAVCHSVREDGVYVEAGENDNLIVQKLEANPSAFGVFGFSFLDQNADKVQGAMIDGVAPEFELIADGSYPVSRSLYFYVKKAHVGVIPGIKEFLDEFTREGPGATTAT